ERDRMAFHAARQVATGHERATIAPMGVVEDSEDRPRLREVRHQPVEPVEDVLRGVAARPGIGRQVGETKYRSGRGGGARKEGFALGLGGTDHGLLQHLPDYSVLDL